MLLSMTGFGEGRCQENGLTVSVEARTVNSRYFKLSVRATEGYGMLEPLIEEEIRKSIHRGTIQVALRVDRKRPVEDFRINAEVLERYRSQLEELRTQWHAGSDISLDALLTLPGVVDDSSAADRDLAAEWPTINKAIAAAMETLGRMRSKEGAAMAADLSANCKAVAASLAEIEVRAPLVAEDYRVRLHDRLAKALAEHSVSLEPGDLLKDVSLFADRADISEEIVRLRSHCEQFLATLNAPESSGRKLEFLSQEMIRETNTIGSKANDVTIARHVIEIKTAIERIREMVQNVE